MQKRFRCGCLVLIFLSLAGCERPKEPLPQVRPTPIPKEAMKVGDRTIQVEIAKDKATRTRGLMFRDFLEKDAGMLFVFDEAAYHRFYMKNTHIPLSIAFVKEDGTIISIHDMEPFDEKARHFPKRKALYALEMNQGWFEEAGIGPGDRVELPDSLKGEGK